MRRCAVIGSPIAHSLSPLLHRTAYRLLGVDDQYRYDAFEVTPEVLPGFVAGLGDEWVGLSVTAPNKEALLAEGEPDAIAAGLRAGNTLILGRDGEPNRVHNTDVTGMLAALAGAGVSEASRAVLVGNGATARSATWVLGELGVRQVLVAARDEQRARASLAAVADSHGIELLVQPFGEPLALPEGWGPRADLLVSTVPVQFPDAYAAHLVNLADTVFEVVYNHYPSALDRAAGRADVRSLDGLDLLVAQAIDQIRLMTGLTAEPAPLLEVCRAEVLRRLADAGH